MFEVSFQAATVRRCDMYGRTVDGVLAVVTRDGVEVYRTKPSVKRINPRQEAAAWIAAQTVEARA